MRSFLLIGDIRYYHNGGCSLGPPLEISLKTRIRAEMNHASHIRLPAVIDRMAALKRAS
jgi:hypothetical protein